MHYYNDNDQYACLVLQNLQDLGLIPRGKIDDRDIQKVEAADLDKFSQCHFFGGIAGWSEALQIAGYSDISGIWTGSCPCQPFSGINKSRNRTTDTRHVWPELYRLIEQCKPPIVFGEQVAGKDAMAWLCGVRNDLEKSGYAVGAAHLCASTVGAPHLRPRLYWGAILADAYSKDDRICQARSIAAEYKSKNNNEIYDNVAGYKRSDVPYRLAGLCENGRWNEYCIHKSMYDGQWRRTKPGTCVLANGISRRMDHGGQKLFGNAIVPPLGAFFIQSFFEALNDAV